jgi:hypothetical protein
MPLNPTSTWFERPVNLWKELLKIMCGGVAGGARTFTSLYDEAHFRQVLSPNVGSVGGYRARCELVPSRVGGACLAAPTMGGRQISSGTDPSWPDSLTL